MPCAVTGGLLLLEGKASEQKLCHRPPQVTQHTWRMPRLLRNMKWVLTARAACLPCFRIHGLLVLKLRGGIWSSTAFESDNCRGLTAYCTSHPSLNFESLESMESYQPSYQPCDRCPVNKSWMEEASPSGPYLVCKTEISAYLPYPVQWLTLVSCACFYE